MPPERDWPESPAPQGCHATVHGAHGLHSNNTMDIVESCICGSRTYKELVWFEILAHETPKIGKFIYPAHNENSTIFPSLGISCLVYFKPHNFFISSRATNPLYTNSL